MFQKLLLLLLSVSPLAPPGNVEGTIYMQMKRTLAALVTVAA